ncbi:hypothetical protein [Mycobacteroides abscessus]|nr:hypothetical protein [Mycobacteroides abscessus]
MNSLKLSFVLALLMSGAMIESLLGRLRGPRRRELIGHLLT